MKNLQKPQNPMIPWEIKELHIVINKVSLTGVLVLGWTSAKKGEIMWDLAIWVMYLACPITPTNKLVVIPFNVPCESTQNAMHQIQHSYLALCCIKRNAFNIKISNLSKCKKEKGCFEFWLHNTQKLKLKLHGLLQIINSNKLKQLKIASLNPKWSIFF